jgi:hypothetical protein
MTCVPVFSRFCLPASPRSGGTAACHRARRPRDHRGHPDIQRRQRGASPRARPPRPRTRAPPRVRPPRARRSPPDRRPAKDHRVMRSSFLQPARLTHSIGRSSVSTSLFGSSEIRSSSMTSARTRTPRPARPAPPSAAPRPPQHCLLREGGRGRTSDVAGCRSSRPRSGEATPSPSPALARLESTWTVSCLSQVRTRPSAAACTAYPLLAAGRFSPTA